MDSKGITIKATQTLQSGETIWDAVHNESVRGFGSDDRQVIPFTSSSSCLRAAAICHHRSPWLPLFLGALKDERAPVPILVPSSVLRPEPSPRRSSLSAFLRRIEADAAISRGMVRPNRPISRISAMICFGIWSSISIRISFGTRRSVMNRSTDSFTC